jgi:hypothetical protein
MLQLHPGLQDHVGALILCIISQEGFWDGISKNGFSVFCPCRRVEFVELVSLTTVLGILGPRSLKVLIFLKIEITHTVPGWTGPGL